MLQFKAFSKIFRRAIRIFAVISAVAPLVLVSVLMAGTLATAQTTPTKALSQSEGEAGGGESLAVLRRVVVVRGPGGVSVELMLTGPVKPVLSTVEAPIRIVVDLPRTVMVTPQRRIAVSQRGVKTVRLGMDGQVPPTTRVVVDLLHPLDYEIVPGSRNILVLTLHSPSASNLKSVNSPDQTKEATHPEHQAPASPVSSIWPLDRQPAPIAPNSSAPLDASDHSGAADSPGAEIALPGAPAQSPVGQAAPMMLKSAVLTVFGVVEDLSGAVIPAADLTLVERKSGALRHTVSDNLGQFMFKDVAPGHYLLRGKAEDAESAEKEVVVEGSAVAVKLQMKVSVEEQVKVSATEPDPVSAENNSDAVDLSPVLLRGLPTDSQNIVPLLSNFVAPAAGGTEGISLVVDGMEADQLDDLPASAIKEVNINRNPYAVEFRRPGKARVEVTTKHGSPKRYHGHFGMFARDSVFDASNVLAVQQPDLSRKLFEGSFSGPLGLKGAAFFLSGQHLGDMESAIVDATVLNGANQPVPLIENIPTGRHRNDYLARLDFKPGHAHRLTAFYSFDEKFQSNSGVGGFDLPDRGISTALRGHKVQFMDQAIVSSTLLNTSRLLLRRSSSREGDLPSGYAIDVNGSFSSGPSQTAQQQRETLVEFEDVATYGLKNQTFRFGGGTRTRIFDVTDQSNFGGTFKFSSLDTYQKGKPYVFSMNQGPPSATFTIHEASGFAQDELRLHSSLSVVAGLRYDWQSSINNFTSLAPRLALAFSPGEHKSVVRAGAGVFYEYLPHSASEQALLLDGAHIQQVVITDPSYPNPFAGGTSRPPSVVRIAPNLTTPYLLQAGVSVEHELGARNRVVVEYQHLRGFHLLRSRDINAPSPLTGVRPDPNFFNINQVESTAFLRGDALTVSYRGGIGKRFRGIVQYTFAKTINDTSGVFSLPADNYDLRPEVGPADYDRRHQLNFAALLSLPAAFRVGTLFHVASAIPFNITTGTDNNHDSVANDRPPGVTRNTGVGPGLLQLDVRLTKLFAVWRPANRERHSRNLEVSIDAFNVLNHTNYPNFVGVMTSPLFGRPNTALPARTMQTSLAYRF